MIISSFDLTSVRRGIEDLTDALANRILKKGTDAGGEVVVNAYKAALQDRMTTPGTYVSSAKTVEHFMHAYLAVGKRSLLFKDKSGAYTVVGIRAAPGNWRPLAPQAMWLESGTVDRYHKSDGQYTGHVTAQHVLAGVVAATAAQAQQVCVDTIRRELDRELTQRPT